MAEQTVKEEDERRSPADKAASGTQPAPKRAVSDEDAIGDDPESRGDPYTGSAK
jgi:hypothetical protein